MKKRRRDEREMEKKEGARKDGRREGKRVDHGALFRKPGTAEGGRDGRQEPLLDVQTDKGEEDLWATLFTGTSTTGTDSEVDRGGGGFESWWWLVVGSSEVCIQHRSERTRGERGGLRVEPGE